MKRREFIRHSSVLAGTYAFGALSRVVSAQSAVPDETSENPGVFPQGVGSADPQPDAVLLWTRAVPADGATASLGLIVQLARTPTFDDLVIEQPITAVSESDYTVRVRVEDLQPDTTYYYRFITRDGSSSRTGRTLTAPSPDADRAVAIAFVSCQSYQTGFFGPYRRLMNDDGDRRIDFVLHLGDYIYENAIPATDEALYYQDGSERVLPEFPSGGMLGFRNTFAATTLDDYRLLYKTYLSDPDLQAVRALYPFVCTWDDHEFADDYWQSYVNGRSMPRRRMGACRAWSEYVPALLSDSGSVREVDNEARDFAFAEVEDAPIVPFDETFLSLEPNSRKAVDAIRIYRSVRFGKNVELLLTDLRSYRSPSASFSHSMESLAGSAEPPQVPNLGIDDDTIAILAAGSTWAGGNPPETIQPYGVEIPNPRRDAPPVTTMGARQKAWFKRCLERSDAVWKVWANSLPAMRCAIDVSRIDKQRRDAVLWTADTWNGYPNERNELMAFLDENDITNVLSLSGDRHLHAASLVARDHLAEPVRYVMPDFTVASISMRTRLELPTFPVRGLGEDFAVLVSYTVSDADGTERLLPNLNVTMRHGVLSGLAMAESNDPAEAATTAHLSLNPHIDYVDTFVQGYGIARFDGDGATVELVAVDPETRTEHFGSQGPPLKYAVQYRVGAWNVGEEPQLERVRSEGEPIFGDLL